MSETITRKAVVFLTSCVLVNVLLVYLFPPYRYTLGIFVIGAYFLNRANEGEESFFGSLSDSNIWRITIYGYIGTAIGLFVSGLTYLIIK